MGASTDMTVVGRDCSAGLVALPEAFASGQNTHDTYRRI
jgi:hypothetical protein